MVSTSTLRLDSLSELRAQKVAPGTVVLLAGKSSPGDGYAALYRWDESSTRSDDSSTLMNSIASTRPGLTTGRWLRLVQRIGTYPHGSMEFRGPIKTFYAAGVLDANGEVTINLTENDTSTGVAFFTAIWSDIGSARVNAATANDIIVGSCKAVAPDLKTMTYRFARGGSTTLGGTLLSILGLVIPGLRAAPAGTPVTITVTGPGNMM